MKGRELGDEACQEARIKEELEYAAVVSRVSIAQRIQY